MQFPCQPGSLFGHSRTGNVLEQLKIGESDAQRAKICRHFVEFFLAQRLCADEFHETNR